MRQFATVFLLAALVSLAHAAPQLISFKDGKIGVNFAGYHAAAGLGGLLGNGASGGLFAEAGTPFGQSAKAGLGGAVEANGGTAGGLYAGATAGGNVRASTGLAGGVTAEKSAGSGYASAQAGDRFASSGLGGEASGAGATGFTFSGSKSFGTNSGVVKEKAVVIQPVETVEVFQPVKQIQTEVKVEAQNEVKPVALTPSVAADFDVKAEAPAAVLVKEVYVPQQPIVGVQKEVYRARYKPHRHHYRKHAFLGGYVGTGGEIHPPAPVVYKTVQPAIEKRIDIGAESAVNAGAEDHADVSGSGAGQYGYRKEVTLQRNPTFFADIFNIPISTLKAVGNFLGNAAGSTSVSVQKTASIQADSDSVSSKHVPTSSSSSSSSSSDTQLSIQTPPVSKFIDDIFSIPINTLGAVNKFLENNVPARKNVEVREGGEPTRVHLGPHARRRANRKVVFVQSTDSPTTEAKTLTE